MDIKVEQMPYFKKAYKKLYADQKALVNLAIINIIKNPEIGEPKRGDLLGLYVYKFKINNVEMLLAYEWDPKQRILIALGVHENFYRDLKSRF